MKPNLSHHSIFTLCVEVITCYKIGGQHMAFPEPAMLDRLTGLLIIKKGTASLSALIAH